MPGHPTWRLFLIGFVPTAALLVPLGRGGEPPEAPPSVRQPPIPAIARTGNFVDPAAVFAPDESAAIARAVERVRAETGEDFVFAVAPHLGSVDVGRYAFELRRGWPIGDPVRDDGVLMLYAPTIHRVLIESGGGISHRFDKPAIDAVLADMTPYFRRGDRIGAMITGIELIGKELERDR